VIEILNSLIHGKQIDASKAEAIMAEVIAGHVMPEQVGALFALLATRTPNSEMLAGFVRAFRKHAIKVEVDSSLFPNVIDVCGTGGDGQGSFNISTCVAFVAAGAGQLIAKHGNRAVSSRCGSFDVLDALAVPYAESEDEVLQMLKRHRLAFLFAPSYHPAFRNLAQLRKSLGIRTILNALGPLLNPAGVRRQLVGVYSRELIVPVAEALGELGSEEVLVVSGEDGADEISLCAATNISHFKNGKTTVSRISPEDFGLQRASPEALLGGSAQKNAKILTDLLNGQKGPCRDVVILNAGAALMVGGRAENLKEGIEQARKSIDSRRAASLLEDLQESLACGAAL
jgi:anthranilate phosphoribosyltransferase